MQRSLLGAKSLALQSPHDTHSFSVSSLNFESCTASVSHPTRHVLHMVSQRDLWWTTEDSKTQKMTYPLRVICGTVKPSLGLLVIQSRAR